MSDLKRLQKQPFRVKKGHKIRLVALYWKAKKEPFSTGVKRGLARAFTKFDASQLAEHDRESVVKLRDVLLLCHVKPKDEAQAEV